MSRKNIVYDYKPIANGDMSQASIVGAITTIAQHDTITYDFKWTGGQTTNGDMAIEYSRDEGPQKTWTELNFGTTTPADGAADSASFIITEVGFKYVRPKYTRTNAGATGTITVEMFATNKGA